LHQSVEVRRVLSERRASKHEECAEELHLLSLRSRFLSLPLGV
jgi:hypothetical protein